MRQSFRFEAAAGVLACLVGAGCSQMPTATSPSSATASMISIDQEVVLASRQPNLTIEDLESRGWDCRPAPMNPIRQTCIAPNQLHPTQFPGPSPDNPPSVSLLVFDNGVFVATDLLIRADLYQGQTCRTLEGPYRFIGRIGYYECPHEPAN